MKKNNNMIFLSEYKPPNSDFKLIWSKGKEKLFIM